MRVVQMEPGPMPTFTRVRARVDQRPCAVIGGDVAGDDLHPVALALHPLDRPGHMDGVAVGGCRSPTTSTPASISAMERS